MLVTVQLPPLAVAYCTDQFVTFMGALLGLNSSIKSWSHEAPLLPPAAYIWLITRWFTLPVGVTVGVLVIVGVRVGVFVRPPMGVLVAVDVGVAKQLLM